MINVLADMSKEDREKFHVMLDKVWDAGDKDGLVMICWAFQRKKITGATCFAGAMNTDDVVATVDALGMHLLLQMTRHRAGMPLLEEVVL